VRVCVRVCVRACMCVFDSSDGHYKKLGLYTIMTDLAQYVCLLVCLFESSLFSWTTRFFFWLFCVGVVFLFFLSRYLACLDACDDRKVGSGSLADLSQEANRLASR